MVTAKKGNMGKDRHIAYESFLRLIQAAQKANYRLKNRGNMENKQTFLERTTALMKDPRAALLPAPLKTLFLDMSKALDRLESADPCNGCTGCNKQK